MSSVACLWGMPQGAAGPERGVETPNLMTSAARALPVPTATSAATARNVAQITKRRGFIPPLLDTMLGQGPRAPRTIETRVTSCQWGKAVRVERARRLGLALERADDVGREPLELSEVWIFEPPPTHNSGTRGSNGSIVTCWKR